MNRETERDREMERDMERGGVHSPTGGLGENTLEAACIRPVTRTTPQPPIPES